MAWNIALVIRDQALAPFRTAVLRPALKRTEKGQVKKKIRKSTRPTIGIKRV